DFPEPLGPIRPASVPGGSDRETSWRRPGTVADLSVRAVMLSDFGVGHREHGGRRFDLQNLNRRKRRGTGDGVFNRELHGGEWMAEEAERGQDFLRRSQRKKGPPMREVTMPTRRPPAKRPRR